MNYRALVGVAGFEPTTFRFQAGSSDQTELHSDLECYGRATRLTRTVVMVLTSEWKRERDLNPRSSPYEGDEDGRTPPSRRRDIAQSPHPCNMRTCAPQTDIAPVSGGPMARRRIVSPEMRVRFAP